MGWSDYGIDRRTCASARILCGAGCAVFPFRPPRQTPRGWSAARRIHSTHALRRARPWRRTRAPRRSIAAISVPGTTLPRAEGPVFPGPDPGSFRRPSSASRPAIQGSPSWWGRTATRGLPGAGLRAPPAGAAPGSIFKTSLEDALSEPCIQNIFLFVSKSIALLHCCKLMAGRQTAWAVLGRGRLGNMISRVSH